MKNILFSILGVILLGGCGGATAGAAPNASNEGDPVEEVAAVETVAPDGVNWKGKVFGEREQYMKETVLPKMKELFVAAHPDFNCMSCHGADAKTVNFKMPNTLDPLDPNNMPFNSADEKDVKTAAWMQATVVPAMAQLLGMEPFNPETGEGLGCFACHAKK